MSPVKKSVASRAEAGIVEEDFEQQPNDEVIAAGEAVPEENGEDLGPAFSPSSAKVSGMTEEEQDMEMTPVVVGPPAYGSPDPTTSAGRLLPLNEHPFNPEALPEDHPARIDENYGVGYQANLTPDEIGTQFPGAPQRTDLERDQQGTEEGDDGGDTSYESQTKADLVAEAESRGLDVSGMNKAEVVSTLESDDAA